ncbi:MAG: hypothetical protein K6T78_07855 [Alicyclobacillus sp.]|nr:hypothetical protein [Alicyclobacillus sp.]
MSGPGLTQRDTHHAIHQAALEEAVHLTRMLKSVSAQGDSVKALQLCDVLLEHWDTRILAHADAEETGLYQDLVRADASKSSAIIRLTRDHDLLRTLHAETQRLLSERGWTAGVIERLEALLLLDAIHSRDEESFLFADKGGARDVEG